MADEKFGENLNRVIATELHFFEQNDRLSGDVRQKLFFFGHC